MTPGALTLLGPALLPQAAKGSNEKVQLFVSIVELISTIVTYVFAQDFIGGSFPLTIEALSCREQFQDGIPQARTCNGTETELLIIMS
jgi:hypothetical protein